MDLDELLREHLDDAEARFGRRSNWGYKIMPVQSGGRGFPETHVDHGAGTIKIQLSQHVAASNEVARYQVSHEAIHVLFASGDRDTIFFEEGMACWYSLSHTALSREFRKRAKHQLPRVFGPPLAAFQRVSPSDKQIRSLRAAVPRIGDLTVDMLKEHLEIWGDRARRLCERMPFERPARM